MVTLIFKKLVIFKFIKYLIILISKEFIFLIARFD